MAYQANRYDDDEEKLRSDVNNTNNVRNAADVAIASGNPYAAAAGAAVKGADAISGGRASEALGKGMTDANKIVPGGKALQGLSDDLSESGASDAAGSIAAKKNAVAGNSGGDRPNQVVHNGNSGGEQTSSLPSSRDKNQLPQAPVATGEAVPASSGGDANMETQEEETAEVAQEEKRQGGFVAFIATTIGKVLLFAVLPGAMIILLLFVCLSIVAGAFGEFDDAFGINKTTGGVMGDIEPLYETVTPEQQEFYDLVDSIVAQYQGQDIYIDPLKIVSVFHTINSNGATIDYKDIKRNDIEDIIKAMLNDENIYDEEVFKQNLVEFILPKYLKHKSKEEFEAIAEEVLSYSEDYYSFIDTSGMSSSNIEAEGNYTQWKQYGSSWSGVPMGDSGRTIGQIGCLVTSIAMQIQRSGVQTKIANFNPGTFVQFLNQNGGFASGGNFVWRSAQKAAPRFVYQGQISVAGMSKAQKLAKIKELLDTPGVYVVAEVKGNTGQHWVAINTIQGDRIKMMDPGSSATDMWSKYNWVNTSTLSYFKVS